MLKVVAHLMALIFSRDPDVSTDQGRSLERYRRAAKTSLVALVARAVNISVGLITVPITINYLGPDRYGLWMALTSFVAFLTFTDMGLGIGLQNALSESNGRDDRIAPRYYVSSAMFVLVVIFAVISAVALIVLPLLPLDHVLRVETESARSELLPTAQVVLMVFGYGLFASLIQRVYDSMQQGYYANMWLALGRIMGFAGVLICIWFQKGLPFLVASLMLMPYVFLSLGGISLFKNYPWLRPSLHAINRNAMGRIFKTGGCATLAQIAYVVLQSSPAIIIANRLGTSVITPYAVTGKLLGMVSVIITTLILPLWPAYTEAAARGDWEWVRKTFRRTIYLVTMICVPVFVILTVAGRSIIHLWTQNPAVVPSWSVLMACNVWCLVMAWNSVASMFLNGLNHLAGQATYGILFAAVALGIGYWIAPIYDVAGVVWSIVLIGGVLRSIAMGIEVIWVLRTRVKSIPAAAVH